MSETIFLRLIRYFVYVLVWINSIQKVVVGDVVGLFTNVCLLLIFVVCQLAFSRYDDLEYENKKLRRKLGLLRK